MRRKGVNKVICPLRYEYEPRKRAVYEELCGIITYTKANLNTLNFSVFKGVEKNEIEEIWDVAMKDLSGNSTVDFSYSYKKGRRH